MEATPDKYCAILLAMGGPDSTAGVRQYLKNIFSDRAIIRLPGGLLLQRVLAEIISRLRTKKVSHHYQLIGGRSPLVKWTEAQAKHLEQIVRDTCPDFRAYVGMRYYHPFIETAVREAYNDGFRRICFIPMYPQYCKATTGSSFEAAGRAMESFPDARTTFVKDFHNDQNYISLLRKYIQENVLDSETLLFSAHSIPQKLVDEGDPYVDQISLTAMLAADNREYVLSFQSRTGPVRWVGPDTVDETRRTLAERTGGLFIVPIAFVCDHIETLYEIDIKLKRLVNPDDVTRIRRMPMFNDDPSFARVLAGLVKERMT